MNHISGFHDLRLFLVRIVKLYVRSPPPAMNDRFMAALYTSASQLGRTLHGTTTHQESDGELVTIQAIQESRKARTGAVSKQLLHSEITPAARNDACNLPHLLVVGVAVLKSIFGPLFVIDVDADG
jgi:hypothetical protein